MNILLTICCYIFVFYIFSYFISNLKFINGFNLYRARAGTVIGLSVNISALIAILLHPYMPNISAQLQEQLLLPADCLVIPKYFVPMLQTGHKIGLPSPIFQKIDAAFAEELRKRFTGTRSEKVSRHIGDG